ncbi:hypothetical protein DFP73DRAFT_523433 [Morchella snyderi]|nr:hypothetical protein DFP73DRAFT_523433 [Morchella snyderi]
MCKVDRVFINMFVWGFGVLGLLSFEFFDYSPCYGLIEKSPHPRGRHTLIRESYKYYMYSYNYMYESKIKWKMKRGRIDDDANCDTYRGNSSQRVLALMLKLFKRVL